MAKAKKTVDPSYEDLVARIKAKGDAIIATLRKKNGEESIAWLGDSSVRDVTVIPTGSLALDLATGVGGIPRGRIIEIYGPQSGGKSSLALHIVTEAQRMGLLAAYIDVENAVDKKYARSLGVNTDLLLFSQPGSGEEAIDSALTMTQTNDVGIIVIDSVANLVPQIEIDGDMTDNQMMAQPKMLAKGLRKLSEPAAKSGTMIIFINQLRDAVGATPYQSKDKTPGGRSLPFYASMRLNVKKGEKVKDVNDKIIGHYCNITVDKNKVASPSESAKILFFNNGRGFDRAADTFSTGLTLGVVTQDGTNFAWGDIELGRGANTAIAKLRDDKELLENIRASVIGVMNTAREIITDAVDIDKETGEVTRKKKS
jgi:recombination protein RecA